MEAMATEMGVITGMTSRPIPSPGIKPIRSDLEAIGKCVKINQSFTSHSFEDQYFLACELL